MMDEARDVLLIRIGVALAVLFCEPADNPVAVGLLDAVKDLEKAMKDAAAVGPS
ncbi:MAG: hypothetical protein V3W41_14580 [Planctomycetota bacterium]